MTQNKTEQPSAEVKKLDSIAGRWNTSWKPETLKNDPNGKFEPIGTDIYEWMPGGFFMIHHVDVDMGDGPYNVIEIIGYDSKTGKYPMQSFDSKGIAQTMQGSVDSDGVWTFRGDTVRATLTVAGEGKSMKAHWEQTEDNGKTWKPWMDMQFDRAS